MNSRQKKGLRALVVLVVAIGLAISLSGCFLFDSIAMMAVAEGFISSMNNGSALGRASARSTYVHPDADKYGAIGSDGAYWDTYFAEGEAGSFVIDTAASGDTVSGYIDSSVTYDSDDIIFTMQKDGSTWKIIDLDVAGSDVI